MKILGLFLISYDAIRSLNHIQKIQTHWVDLPEPNKIKNENGIKYAKSALDKETSLNIKERIITYMEQHKPYLEPQLRIKDLSELTEIPPHHLSQVINELLQQNFYEFVNSYRIKEAIRLLKDPKYKTYTYEAIGFEVGFNSKSAFYKAFKKETNTTPAKFK
jgi:AraC-like DNA-binding protein